MIQCSLLNTLKLQLIGTVEWIVKLAGLHVSSFGLLPVLLLFFVLRITDNNACGIFFALPSACVPHGNNCSLRPTLVYLALSVWEWRYTPCKFLSCGMQLDVYPYLCVTKWCHLLLTWELGLLSFEGEKNPKLSEEQHARLTRWVRKWDKKKYSQKENTS